MQFKCEICDKEYDTLWSLSSHNFKNINTKRKEYLNFNINPYHYKMVGFFYYNVIFINIIV